DRGAQAVVLGARAGRLVQPGHEAGELVEQARELRRVPGARGERRAGRVGERDDVLAVGVQERAQVVRGRGDAGEQRAQVVALLDDRAAGDGELLERVEQVGRGRVDVAGEVGELGDVGQQVRDGREIGRAHV